jgi:hypothetical protein
VVLKALKAFIRHICGERYTVIWLSHFLHCTSALPEGVFDATEKPFSVRELSQPAETALKWHWTKFLGPKKDFRMYQLGPSTHRTRG